jgi:tripartite-type tricarboxylate transporter receptor subunit TctC
MRIKLAALGLLLAASAASTQDLPCSPLRLVVPYPAGGATDVAARLIAERLEPALKKTVVIENRAGATGNIGTVAVVQSTPDGCTLLVNAASIATFTVSFSRPGYDALKDLIPVGGIGLTPTLLVTAAANQQAI